MERISRDNAVLCLIDHQLGLISGVRDITVAELKHNVVGLTKAAQVLGLPVIVATTAKNDLWGPTAPELLEALDDGYASIDRMTVNAWDEPAFVEAVEATGRTHLIFAAVSLQVCAAYPAYSAIDAGYTSYVVVDASGTFSQTQRDAGIARMTQKGVILTDYMSIMVEIMQSNADPKALEVYKALDLDFAVLVQQIASADATKAFTFQQGANPR
jgi:nicotinamidase-related amidase